MFKKGKFQSIKEILYDFSIGKLGETVSDLGKVEKVEKLWKIGKITEESKRKIKNWDNTWNIAKRIEKLQKIMQKNYAKLENHGRVGKFWKMSEKRGKVRKYVENYEKSMAEIPWKFLKNHKAHL